ncbi:pilus assembly protein [Desulfurobacterium sp.]
MRKFLIFFMFLLTFGRSYAGSLNPYFSLPPFLQQGKFANLMLVLDYSGSMNDYAYFDTYNDSSNYYGYFIGKQKYSLETFVTDDGNYVYVWVPSSSGDTGNYLNWEYMRKIDILRWILTGGPVKKLTLVSHGKKVSGYYVLLKTMEGKRYIPVKYVTSYNSTTGQVEGVLQKIERLKEHPRVGLEIFSGTNVVRKWIYPSFKYKKVISAINYKPAKDGTPTGEALDEVRRYFSREDGVWGGFKKSDSSYVDPYKFKINGTWMDVHCTKNYVLLISDGAWNGHKFSKRLRDLDCKHGSYPIIDPVDASAPYACTIDPVQPAYEMWEGGYADLVPDLKGRQNVKVYTVSAFINSSKFDDIVGLNALKNIAVFGGYKGSFSDELPSGYSSVPPQPVCSVTQSPPCGSFVSLPSSSSDWDADGDGRPDDFYPGNNPAALKKAIENIFAAILKDAFSGTSAGILPERKKSGVVAEQTLFYPRKDFSGKNVDWPGYLYTWWLLNKKAVQNIREDTNLNKILDIKDDRILRWRVDPDTGKVSIDLYSSYLNGTAKRKIATYDTFDDLHPVWEAGENLAFTSPDSREIFTDIKGRLVEFNNFNKDLISEYVGDLTEPSCLNNDVANLIAFIRGKDVKGCRIRDIDDSGNTWKLGDIIYSSPTIVKYPDYSVVFVGANDGMLHAFRLGYVKDLDSSLHPVKLTDSFNSTSQDLLGEELWAFIPSNALPYLKYLASPNYEHTYYVDLKPFIVTYKSRIILIGGMRFGGVPGNSRRLTPPPNDAGVGYSSYFALDVTDPENPKFLWEFSSKSLGFSYSGPAVINKGDKIYVMFASGPTDYNGDVDQPLSVYILDLLTGKEIRNVTIDELPNAFAGRLFTNGLDVNDDGKTDFVFFGYSKKFADMQDWKGGIIVADVRSDDPVNWKFNIYLKNKIPPVTSKVAVGKYFGRYYIFFGTGRWFYKEDNPNPEVANRIYGLPLIHSGDNWSLPDASSIVDVTETSASVCSISSTLPLGWYIKLNTDDDGYLKERLISDPTITDLNVVAFVTTEPTADVCGFGGRSRIWLLNGASGSSIFDNCTRYSMDRKNLKGSLLVQLSTAAIHKVSLKSEASQFDNTTNKRTVLNSDTGSGWFTGVAPEGGAKFVPPSGGKGELLLWMEK